MNHSSLETLRTLLCQLGDAIRNTLLEQRSRSIEDLSALAATTDADFIYQIDKVSEELILRWLRTHWPQTEPVQLIMEGIPDSEFTCFPENAAADTIKHKLIIDPIDGTRGLMYDKRPAWALLGLAPNLGDSTRLEDIHVACMTELPTSKQYLAEQLSATRYPDKIYDFHRVSINLLNEEQKRVPHLPSKATDLRHGFASVAKFFPQAKTALAAFEEELFTTLTPEKERQEALIFDDQYISTGGQLYELIAGHDRLVFDIRPIAYRSQAYPESLSCHAYDLCAALVARAAGVVVETPDSSQLSIPLNTTTSVSWIAYANESLANKIRPLARNLMEKHFGSAETSAAHPE